MKAISGDCDDKGCTSLDTLVVKRKKKRETLHMQICLGFHTDVVLLKSPRGPTGGDAHTVDNVYS